MPRRGKRQRLRTGIYQDRAGLSGVATCGRQSRERRWPHGTPLDEIERWRRDTRYEMEQYEPKAPRGTMGGDAARYFKAVADLASFVARRSEIRAWIAALGARTRRASVTLDRIRAIRGDWLKDDVAPKTINNRVFALQHLYRTLDGKRIPTPCDDLPPLTVTKRPAVRIPDDTIRAIYQTLLDLEAVGRLRDAKTRARFAVFASTGHRPCEIGRAERRDVNLERRIWTPRDAKGGFCPGVYLNDDMLEAWKLFIDVDAFGAFDSGSFAQRIRNAGLPDDVTPYQLRHTVGITASETPGVDLKDVGDHLGHKRIETTRRHYVPVLDSRLQRLSEALDRRALGWKANDAPDREAARLRLTARRGAGKGAKTATGNS